MIFYIAEKESRSWEMLRAQIGNLGHKERGRKLLEASHHL